MKVKVEFTLETEDFEGKKFKPEIEKLITDIDPETELVEFQMYNLQNLIDDRNLFWVKEKEI